MNRYEVNINSINEKVDSLQDFIQACENKYHNQINDIAKHIRNEGDKIKFVLVAGPSSAGKTTTAKLLCAALSREGYNAKSISLDDFFVDRELTPFWEDGSRNYESVDAIDWALFDKCMNELLKEKKSELPTYDFKEGKKFFRTGTTTFEDGTIMVIEGLHALNPIIDNFIPTQNSEKVYLSIRADIMENGERLFSGNGIRFVRRLIRDLYTRGASIEDTYAMWKYVRKGEDLYIQPFKNTAKFYVNTFHAYELCVYKQILEDLQQKGINPQEINEKLKNFRTIDKKEVPLTSVLQEFVH